MKVKRIISAVAAALLVFACASCVQPAEPAVVTVTETEPGTTQPDTTDRAADTTGTHTAPETVPEPLKRIFVNEVMPDNDSFVLGCFDDWIELYNDEDEDVLLSSFYLRKGAEDDKKLPLDGYTIPAKGYLVVTLGEDAPFRLPKEGATVVLRYGKQTVDFLGYDGEAGSVSYSSAGPCMNATPGYPNTTSGYEEYKKSLTLPALYISEAMSSNKKYARCDGKYYDLAELHNGGDTSVRLSDYYLSDKRGDLKRYRLPDVELKSGQYYLIYCSGLSAKDHAPFKISSGGEALYLSDGEKVIDYLFVPSDLKQNESYGRNGAASVYMTEPTPGKENNSGYSDALRAPEASVPSGSYPGPVTVTLKADGSIYYTLDGTEPDAGSIRYTEPIVIGKMTCIRAVCRKNGRTSPLSSFFYAIGEEHEYPILNIAIKEEYLTGDEGVLVNVVKEYEHEAYITMMDGGAELFSAPCGFRLHGNDSKEGNKQNFQLRFRSKYGLGTLDYPLFGDRDYTTFNSLLLHGGSEDYKFAGFRDELCTTLVDGKTELNVLACRPVVLFFNGEYRGMYWLRERYDTLYCANRLGVSRGSINLLHTYGSVSAGTNEGYLSLLRFCERNDLRNEENYRYVMDRIDAVSLMDWYICRSYVGDRDLANVRFFQSTEDDGKWHWCYFDLDWAFWHNETNAVSVTMPNNGCHTMIRALLKNPEFEDMFLKRYAELMKTVLNEDAILERLGYFEAQYKTEVVRDRTMYGLPVDVWQDRLDSIRNFVKGGLRQRNVLKSIRSFFGLSDEQMQTYFSDLM